MLSVKVKWNRCLEFTLPSGKTVVVKVQGDKDAAKADAVSLLSALNSAATN